MADGDGKFFNLDLCKTELDISSTDESDDTYLSDRGRDQDKVLENDLSPFLTEIPVLSADVTDDLTLASVYGVARRYKIRIKEFENANQYKSLYNETVESVKKRLISQRTTRTRRSAVTRPYATSPLSDE